MRSITDRWPQRAPSRGGGAGRQLARRAVLLLLTGALLVPLPPVAASAAASEPELTARLADLSLDLSAIERETAELEIEAQHLRRSVDRTTSRIAQLESQRAATLQLHRVHLDLSHRRRTIEEVDAALDALLLRSGVAGGTTDWYRTQLGAMDATDGAGTAAGIVGAGSSPTSDRYDPATSAILSAPGRPLASSSTDHGRLELRYTVHASLVFAELQLRLDQTEQAATGPRQQLDEVLLPALERSRERERTVSAARDALAAELARERERHQRGDRLDVPVDGPHRVSSAFGMRRHPVNGDIRMHHGIDLAAPVGTPVVAAAPGRVVATGSRSGYGRTVDIDHGRGQLTRYAHLHTIEVVRGEQLPGGARVGTVGATGTVTGPHLHFEVREHGHAVDPAPWLFGPSGRH